MTNQKSASLITVHLRNIVLVPFLALALLATSCVASSDPEDDDGQNQEASPSPTGGTSTPEGQEDVIASTVTSSSEYGNKLQIDIHSLVRHGPDTVILNFSMVNLGASESIAVPPAPEGGSAPDLQTFFLIDGENSNKHFPALYEDGTCYCSEWTETSVSPGDRVKLWLAFPAPPGGVDSMIFTSAIAPPILDIPITKKDGGKAEDPKASLRKPTIWELRSFTDDLEGASGREETNDQISISLSTDILFETGKSNLDGAANDSLKQVAKEIDESSDSEIEVDGHTDNTGNSTFNDPLSEDRAKAVQSALAELVTRADVKYAVAGHGSNDPIATNETENGRAKNRRVTITFDK